MYLSRIRLNTDKRSTQIALASRNKLHGAVEQCFDSKADRKLWRVDQLSGHTYLMILSQERPVLTQISQQFGFSEDGGEMKDYDVLLNKVKNGSVWKFRLTANPTHTIKKEGMSRGKVVAHVSEKYQMEWLHQKAAQNGFTILTEGSCVQSTGWRIFYKKNQQSKVRLREVVFEGVLRVDDSDMFRRALIEGIGRGKAYGMGLLTVMRG